MSPSFIISERWNCDQNNDDDDQYDRGGIEFNVEGERFSVSDRNFEFSLALVSFYHRLITM